MDCCPMSYWCVPGDGPTPGVPDEYDGSVVHPPEGAEGPAYATFAEAAEACPVTATCGGEEYTVPGDELLGSLVNVTGCYVAQTQDISGGMGAPSGWCADADCGGYWVTGPLIWPNGWFCVGEPLVVDTTACTGYGSSQHCFEVQVRICLGYDGPGTVRQDIDIRYDHGGTGTRGLFEAEPGWTQTGMDGPLSTACNLTRTLTGYDATFDSPELIGKITFFAAGGAETGSGDLYIS